MSVDVKICGLKTPSAVDAAVDAGAALCGFVFFRRSPRHLEFSTAARLVERVPDGVLRVALMVDPSDPDIDALLRAVHIDILQLHGGETPYRVSDIRERFRSPVMKALPIASAEDLAAARLYEAVADWLLFDAKPPHDADRPGGNARPFDWTLLAGTRWRRPWLLAGGLTVDNLADAVAASGATAVDVSSGVEEAPGDKSPLMIRRFLDRAAEL